MHKIVYGNSNKLIYAVSNNDINIHNKNNFMLKYNCKFNYNFNILYASFIKNNIMVLLTKDNKMIIIKIEQNFCNYIYSKNVNYLKNVSNLFVINEIIYLHSGYDIYYISYSDVYASNKINIRKYSYLKNIKYIHFGNFNEREYLLITKKGYNSIRVYEVSSLINHYTKDSNNVGFGDDFKIPTFIIIFFLFFFYHVLCFNKKSENNSYNPNNNYANNDINDTNKEELIKLKNKLEEIANLENLNKIISKNN